MYSQSDLSIVIFPRHCTRYYGTSEQLCSEGLIPDGFNWPNRTKSVSFVIGEFSFYMHRSKKPCAKGPWASGDYWFVQRSLNTDIGTGLKGAVIYAKSKELMKAIWRFSTECDHQSHKAYKAKNDAAYMAFRKQLLNNVCPHIESACSGKRLPLSSTEFVEVRKTIRPF